MRRILIAALAVACTSACVPSHDDRETLPPKQTVPMITEPMLPDVSSMQPTVMELDHAINVDSIMFDEESMDLGEQFRRCDQYDDLFRAAALRHLPWGLKDAEGARRLKAQAFKESSCRPHVCSDQDACGMMQFLPGTAMDLGIGDRFDPLESVDGGARYMAWLYGQWQAFDRTVDQRWWLALDGYFRGLGRTLRAQQEWGCVNWPDCFRDYAPPLTESYVVTISGYAGHPLEESP